MALAALPPLDPRAEALAERQDDLLAAWEGVWLDGWGEVLDGWTFRRGLVEAVAADASVFLDHAADWFGRWPTLAAAKLTRAAGHLPELAASPWLAHLRGLDLSANGIDGDLLAALTGTRFICLLEALDLSDNPIGPAGARFLASARAADRLSELHLARCGLGGPVLAGLLLGRRSRQWRRLDLAGNDLRRRDLVMLTDSAVMRDLAALDLARNPLGDHGTSVLSDSPTAAGLNDLGLCCTGTGNAELAALAGSPHLTGLPSLDLRGHCCTTHFDRDGEPRGGIVELARSPLLSQLRRLLLAAPGRSKGWVAEVLAVLRPPRRPALSCDGWTAALLRRSRYLIPSQLVECDLEELWWLGNTAARERIPPVWADVS
jgi:hypothetical protein